jgi:hypothetical protein
MFYEYWNEGAKLYRFLHQKIKKPLKKSEKNY